MKPIWMTLLLVALVGAACGTNLRPHVEQSAPATTVAPIVAPSSAASPTDPAPVKPTTTLETRPMSDDELDGKVRELAAFGAPFVDAPALIAVIRGIEEESDAGRIVGLAVPASQ